MFFLTSGIAGLRSWLCPLPSWHGWAQYETFAKLQGFTQRLLKMPAHGNPQGTNVAMKFNNASAKGSTSCNFFGTCIFGDDFYELWSHIGHIGQSFITMPLSPPCTLSADTGEPIDFNRLSSGGSRPARPRPPTDLWWHTTLNGTDQYRVYKCTTIYDIYVSIYVHWLSFIHLPSILAILKREFWLLL